MEPGKKSVAIAVTLQPTEKTLTDAEIEAVGAKIVAEIGKRFGATLRGDQPSRAAIRNSRLPSPPAMGEGITSRTWRPARRAARTPATAPSSALSSRTRRLAEQLRPTSNCGLISATRSARGA